MTLIIQSPISNLCAIIEEILISKLDMVGSGGIIGRVREVPASTPIRSTVFH